ncbi:MAG TPA: hypothetical protein PKD12_13625 [Nitrospira sp.]|nr:hypothetical protein [Nitrospira sp.]
MILTQRPIVAHEAKTYIRECLEEGKTLARVLLEVQDLERGSITTFLPPEITETDAILFTTGGKLSRLAGEIVQLAGEAGLALRMEPKATTESCLARLLSSGLKADCRRICIFENALAKPDDPYLRTSNVRMLVHKQEVYHLVIQRDLSSDQIVKAIRVAMSPTLFIGALTYGSVDRSFPELIENVASDELKGLAKKAISIVVGA